MKSLSLLPLTALALALFSGCETTSPSGIGSSTADLSFLHKDPKHREKYYVQHRLLPGYFFNSEDGIFFDDMCTDGEAVIERIWAEEITVGDDDAITVEVEEFEGRTLVFVTFPEPRDMPLCYAVAMVGGEGVEPLYLTIEKTLESPGGPPAMVCGWNPGGAHLNYGGISTTELEGFKSWVRQFVSSEEEPTPGAMTKFE